MLKTLTVWNFALLEYVQVEFGTGLNILTGETGAGKSILIDALGAILGQRIGAACIRTGADYLKVEAVFSLDEETLGLHTLLNDLAIDDSEKILIITRQINSTGRSVVLVNGAHVTLNILKKIGAFLVDVHGQNENLALLKEENQLLLLDNYSADLAEMIASYKSVYKLWKNKTREYDEKTKAAREYAQRLDMLRWQDREISEAELKENEDEELENEIKKLSHAEKIADCVSKAYNLLDNNSKNGMGVLLALAKINKNLKDIARYDNSLDNAAKIVEEAAISLQEASYELRDYGEAIDFSPQRLDKLQGRMDVIYRLRKKYGATIADVLAHQQKVKKELSVIENYDDDMLELKKEIAALKSKLAERADMLTNKRKQVAEKLSAAIGEQLVALGMPQAVFNIAIEEAENFLAHGKDNVEMYFSANPGETAKPLAKVASGGELSRIALAIKTVAAAKDLSVPSMVFDEIDTGIGGRTAQMVAERIALVAAYKQVLCITHLPQIACMADSHLYISKSSAENSTVTKVQALSERERINEIARMASGADLSTAALNNAREMVSHAKAKKKSFLINKIKREDYYG